MKLFSLFTSFWEERKRRIQNRGFTCDSCNKELFDYPLHRFCDECEGKLQRNERYRCEKCGRKTVTDGVCLNCKQSTPQFTKGFSALVYDDAVSELINRLKNGDEYLVRYFGERMSEYLLAHLPTLSETDENQPLLLVPVPMTNADKRARGYNQAISLAHVVAEELTKRGVAAEIDEEVLCKQKQTPPQKQCAFSERAENIKGAFHVPKRAKCKDRRILLVDDIMTTGATGNECAARLLGAEAKEVLFLTIAALPEEKYVQTNRRASI